MKLFNFLKKKPVLIEVTVVYTVPDKKAIKELKEQMREYTYKKETLGIEDAQKPEVDELPSVEDRGIMFLPINEIFLLSEHEISEYTLVTLYGGTQVLVDFSMYKFKEYLRKNNFIINELKK